MVQGGLQLLKSPSDPPLLVFLMIVHVVKNTFICKNYIGLMCTQCSLSGQPTNLSPTTQLNMYLMNYYKCSRVSLDIKYPYIQEKVFIALAVIEKELISRSDADKFTKGTLHGHADEILKKKKPIELEAVLEPPEGQESMKCVFVEGAPGVGKSTFALELCRRQEGVEVFSLIILLKLREKRVQEIQNVTELFYHDNSGLQQAVAREVIACEGKGVLFVLDGFDELPTNLRKDSFMVELIQGKHLPACTVLITSRPSATADLLLSCKSQIHKCIEVLGFTHEHIIQYAESMLSDQPEVLEDFLKYISSNPAIHGMMYIPLNSAIVLEIYKANRTTGPIPCTMTQLYTELCFVLLRKYFIEKGDPRLADQLHGNLKDIPLVVKSQFTELGKLAFEGALKEEITFNKLPDGCVDLGFMNVSTGLYLGRKSPVSYSFLHLTLQEFLAAFFISQQPAIEQKLVFIQNAVIKEQFFLGIDASHLDVLWRFMAGLTGFKDVGWELVSTATQVPIMFHNLHRPLLVQILLEIQNEEEIKTACDTIIKEYQTRCKYLHDKKVIVDFEHDSEKIPQNDILWTNTRTPFDCYAVGYCVSASRHQWSFNCSNIGGNEILEMLGYGLRSAGDVCGYFGKLKLTRNSLTHQAITYLSEFPPKILKQINVLDLSYNELNSHAFVSLAGILPQMVSLTSLDVSNNPGSHDGMVEVFQKLCTSKVCELSVFETMLGPNDIHGLSQVIKPSASIKELKIGDKNMPSECVLHLVEIILSSSSLEKVELWCVQYTSKIASKFKLLESNSNLTSLKIVNSFVGVNLVVPYVTKALHKNESLKKLGLPSRYVEWFKCPSCSANLESDTEDHKCDIDLDHQCDIGASGVKQFAEMLKVNKTLEVLVIATSKLTVADAIILRDALQENQTIKHLILHPKIIELDPRIAYHLSYLEGSRLLHQSKKE